jgi:hypothetical protein
MNGQKLLKQKTTSKLDITSLKNGVFILKLNRGKNQKTHKIVVKK